MLQSRTRTTTADKYYVQRDQTIIDGPASYVSPTSSVGIVPHYSSLEDYVWKPGTSRIVYEPPIYTDYLANNPRFRDTVHYKTDISYPISYPCKWAWRVGSTYRSVSVSGFSASRYNAGIHDPASKLVTLGIIDLTAIPTSLVRLAAIKDTLSDAKLLGLPEFNLLAFIGELKDFKGLINFFKFRILDFKNSKKYSDKFLGYNFGVAPLVSDLRKMRKLWNNKGKSIDRWNSFVDSGNKTLNSHLTFIKEDVDGTHYTSYTTNSAVGPMKYEYYYTYNLKSRGVASSYIKPLRILKQDMTELGASLWGLNRPLEAIWQLIPFSFMVDWVSNAGEQIKNFEDAQPTLRHHVVSCGTSIKRSLVASCECYLTVNGYRQCIGRTTSVRHFYRRIALPPSSLGPVSLPFEFSGTVTGTKVLLTSALIHQRLKS